MSDLKPCPFCGSEPIIETDDECTFFYHPENDCVMRGYEYDMDPEMVAAWNRRTQPEATAPAADPIIQAALQRDHDRAVKAIKRAAEFTPEVDGLTPENAIDLLSFKLCNAAPAQDLSAAILGIRFNADYYDPKLQEAFDRGCDEALVAAAALASSANALSAGDSQKALDALLTRIDDAFEAYERYGAICEFEGNSMIYADTLIEIVTLRGEYHAILQSQKGGSNG